MKKIIIGIILVFLGVGSAWADVLMPGQDCSEYDKECYNSCYEIKKAKSNKPAPNELVPMDYSSYYCIDECCKKQAIYCEKPFIGESFDCTNSNNLIKTLLKETGAGFGFRPVEVSVIICIILVAFPFFYLLLNKYFGKYLKKNYQKGLLFSIFSIILTICSIYLVMFFLYYFISFFYYF